MKHEKCALSKSVLRHELEHDRIEIAGTKWLQVLLSIVCTIGMTQYSGAKAKTAKPCVHVGASIN